jgi:LmbE family N-acetylglucosaminyl deacetylase
MNPYSDFVLEYARLLERGKTMPLGGLAPSAPTPVAADAPKALIFAPHPDDECVIGALPLRLLRQARMNVINVAVTHGSNRARQAARFKELQAACAFLGFGLVRTAPNGLEKVNPKTRSADPAHWKSMVAVIAGILEEHQPKVVFFPHDRDWNTTHIAVHHLIVDAMQRLGSALACYTVETEFWGQMDDPNLMVESSSEDVADLIAGLACHVGEVQRNPYHLLQPAWMMDNVRRGGELVGGQGGAPPPFVFATLYRLRRWTGSGLERFYEGGKNLPLTADPAGLTEH